MITVTMEIPLKPGTFAQLQEGAAITMKQTATRPGFRSIRLLRPNEGEDKVLFIEEWESLEDYQAYLAWRADGNPSVGLRENAAGRPITQVWNDGLAAD